MRNIAFSLSAVCCLLAGCSTVTYTTISTYPPGAVIYNRSNTRVGEEPVRLYWEDKDIEDIGYHQWRVGPVTAVWPSGHKETQYITYWSEHHADVGVTIEQKPDSPTFKEDLQIGMQIRSTRALERSAAAQQEMAARPYVEQQQKAIRDMGEALGRLIYNR